MWGGRSPRLVIESVFEREQWIALARMPLLYPEPLDVAWRYIRGGGGYPYVMRVRTPTGMVAPTTYTGADLVTVHEIFGREDYRAGPDVGVVVDIGSNIGISALYMLTRNDRSRCHLYEPVPRNVERLRATLAGYESRYELHEVAVATRAETVTFGIEPTGRYGGIGLDHGFEQIEVRCEEINTVLADVLERESVIDILKVDSEGVEAATVAAIAPEHRRRIRTIYFETARPFNPAPELYTMHFSCMTCALRQLPAAS